MSWLGSQHAKTNLACLDCKHTAKYEHAAGQLCPHCRKPLTHMGVNFKPPRKGNKRQWEKIRRMVEAGMRFNYGCGCSPGRYGRYCEVDHPVKTLSDAKSQLHQRRSDRKFALKPEKVPKRSTLGYRMARKASP